MEQLNPIQWAILPLKKYATFSGRAPRAEYWWFTLATSIVSMFVLLADRRVGTPLFADFGPLRVTYLVAVGLPSYAVLARRLHDLGASGWWSLVRMSGWVLIIAKSEGFSRSYLDQMSGWAVAAIAIVGVCWICAEIALVVSMFIRGTRGPNDYGPDPYGASELEEVFA